MPIYEFECQGCLDKFQKLMKLSDPKPPCPSCDHKEVKKQISIGSFVLKGSGWYKDGYGLKGNKA
jgi:putative FmdB family regulatory protein